MGLAARLKGFMGYPEDDYEQEDESADALVQVTKENVDVQREVVLTKPERFDDVSTIADHINANRIVLLNLESTSRDIARRLLDFLGGAAYAKGGLLKRMAGNVYLITPFNVEFMDDSEEDSSETLF